AWHTLVHVCQRWRYLVFASPGHLDLRLECRIETRAREMLDVWPAFPIVITDYSDSVSGVDNIVAALEQRDRVAMAVVPDSFLGGSAPQLQGFTFHAIPFPALSTLLSSTRNLGELELSGIPRSGYIPPDVMVTCLSAMPRLRSLRFQFDSPQSFPNGESRRHPPLARSTLPALHQLIFGGVNEYFEDLVARIDTPLSQFIGRVEVFKSPASAYIRLFYDTAEVLVSPRTGTDESAELHLQLRYLAQVCSSSLLSFSDVEFLAISSQRLQQSQWGSTAEDFLWLDLLHLFSAVKVLNIDKNSLTPIASTLKEVVKERMTEIFPAIRELSIGEHLPSMPILRAIEKFATARGLFTRLDGPCRWVAG
ncbi:hypothetical protein BGY98DRAFT_1012074, partial [Russula aff. rugulosa BPL654]